MLDLYRLDRGHYPTQEQGLRALLEERSGNDPQGSYARPADLIDPWGRRLVYRQPGIHNPDGFDLHSLGLDGIDGSADDFTSWARR